MAKLYISTSGFSYRHWENGVFYPEGLPRTKQLEYYSKKFNTVELNSPFYHLPAEKTFLNWKNKVPENFVFAVKVSRFITHIKKLQDVEDVWQTFLKRAIFLENKLGPFLFQFPPSFIANEENTKKLEKFLEYLGVNSYNIHKNSRIRFAFEFRHPSWFSKSIYQIFKGYQNITICLIDSPNWIFKEIITGEFVYIRMHGSKALYSSNYSDRELKIWASRIKKYLKQNLDIYIYFNNDAMGYAVKNAKKLLELICQNG